MKKPISHLFFYLIILIYTPLCLAQSTLNMHNVSSTGGITTLKLGTQTVLQGSTTYVKASLFALTGKVVGIPWGWPSNRDTCHFAPSVGNRIAYTGTYSSNWTATELISTTTQYKTKHSYYNDQVIMTFDHVIDGQDLVITLDVENKTEHLLQIHDWMATDCKFTSAPSFTMKMGSYYPAGDIYSPVTAAWDANWGMGISWIKHGMRPIEIRMTPRGYDPNVHQLLLWLKNDPIQPSTSTRYSITIRIDDTPGNWKHLLTPYKTWFNDYFGTEAAYNSDFRIKTLTACSNVDLITTSNPMGFRDNMDTTGWTSYLNTHIASLIGKNIGEVIFWGATGASDRGVNYRPEFDVFPPALANDMNTLRDYFANTLDNKKFGFLARPNTIAYIKNNDDDADVSFNTFDPGHINMAQARFQNLINEGADAFYLDTYGSSVGCFPGSFEASLMYLQKLRELAGPDRLLLTEHGCDAFHVYAARWPGGGDTLGKKPFGLDSYARWLIDKTVEVCRVYNYDGVERALEWGGIPLMNDYLISSSIMQLQATHVSTTGDSLVRTDF